MGADHRARCSISIISFLHHHDSIIIPIFLDKKNLGRETNYPEVTQLAREESQQKAGRLQRLLSLCSSQHPRCLPSCHSLSLSGFLADPGPRSAKQVMRSLLQRQSRKGNRAFQT